MTTPTTRDTDEATRQFREAAAAKKCWTCGCLHTSLTALDRELPATERPADLNAAIEEARSRLLPVKYDCLGCEVCYPPLALNALEITEAACPTEIATEREGWPPLPGAYHALRYGAPVAICTLTSERLAEEIAAKAPPSVAIVGSMHTENLGIERLIRNVLSNPNIRFLIVAGADSRQTIGHLPGQSLIALSQGGIDGCGRIVGAKGKRPILRNVGTTGVEHFRRSVRVTDRVGDETLEPILAEAQRLADESPGPAEPFEVTSRVPVVTGYIPEQMTSDPAGYLVLYVDPRRRLLVLEHYRNDGLLDGVIEGHDAAEIYTPAVAKGLVSRLDHAAYLGRELSRAETALKNGTKYVQDGAPERAIVAAPPSSCGCGPECS